MSFVCSFVKFVLIFLVVKMAQGGKGDPEKDLRDSLTPDKIAFMVDLINEHTDYKVVTSDEFAKMRDALKFETSTPVVKPKVKLENPKLDVKNGDLFEDNHPRDHLNNDDAAPTIQTFSKPRIPIFSGEEKSEVSFDVWKYEIKCIIREKNYSDAILLQSIRGSLKGKARSLLLSLDENVTPLQMIDKLEGVYGNVFTSETLLQQFYSENQQPNQSVAEYGMKLESLVQQAVDKGQINAPAKNDMLRSKFWSGLRDPMLKNASRYKYDTMMDFDQLRKEIRSIELDLSNSSKMVNENKSQQHSTIAQSDKLDELLKTVRSLNKRMESVEGELKKSKDEKPKPNYNQGRYQGQSQGQFRGRFRGNDRGQNRGGPSRFGNNRGHFRGRGFNGNPYDQNNFQTDNLNG